MGAALPRDSLALERLGLGGNDPASIRRRPALHFKTMPIGSHVTLSGADVRLRGLLEAYGFCAVYIDRADVPTKIVMRRHTGPLPPILKLVA